MEIDRRKLVWENVKQIRKVKITDMPKRIIDRFRRIPVRKGLPNK